LNKAHSVRVGAAAGGHRVGKATPGGDHPSAQEPDGDLRVHPYVREQSFQESAPGGAEGTDARFLAAQPPPEALRGRGDPSRLPRITAVVIGRWLDSAPW
jgi:hypothetical protein